MALVEQEKNSTDEMLKRGIIQESRLTRKDAYPIPKTQECLDALQGSEMFSTLDVTFRYHQLPVKKEDIFTYVISRTFRC